ncbi:hypothetical protein CXF85_19195 [Colwellia sp. 75C3]|uniref:hypothetical protein n=1 Tax=Colwellia sp. 75C3 TaxID=888425 RepID=UPI000C33C1EE|nr:hypothetical protein [Colwellia sp. 75C3]PKG81581.1 hypothetical protein CXF85_19195 [Colwellia sp. 75C3]
MINNLGLYSANFNNSTVSQQNTAEIQAIAEKHAESNVKNEEPASVDNNIYLSSRAQKINAISSEFFSGAQLTFDDVSALKEKLYQFGLISKGDYATLTDVKADATSSESDAKTSTTTLTSFLDDFIGRLNADDKDENTENDDVAAESETIIALTAALTTAKKILNNVEEQKLDTDFNSNLKNSLALLKQTINDESFEQLALDDKIGLSKVHQALEIVDRLSPQRLNNDKVNQYINLSFR